MEMMWDMNDIDIITSEVHEIMNIRHENVLSPYACFQHKSEIWIIYPQIKGGFLSELFASHYINGLKDEDVVGTILFDVANALNIIHSSQIKKHKNIRSSSLFMNKLNGKTFLTNFKHNHEVNDNDGDDIFNFGILAMELCFGYIQQQQTKQIISFDSYQQKCQFSSQFQDLVKKCLNKTNQQITIKQILNDKFFIDHKFKYDKVIQCIEPIKSIESKMLPLYHHSDELLFNTTTTKTKSQQSLRSFKSKRSMKTVIDDNESWDFGDDDIDFNDNDNIYSIQPTLILDQVDYGDDDEKDEQKQRENEQYDETLSDIDDDDDDDKPSINHEYSNTQYSTISRLSPLASNTNKLIRINTNNNNNRKKYKLPNIIKLNVGGYIFTTSLTTLRKYDTMLSKKFSGDYDEPQWDEETNAYFIDRDGTHFKHILNYLRSGKLIISTPSTSNCSLSLFHQELYEEAKYYQIDNLINLLNPENIYFYSKIIPNKNYVNILKKWVSFPTISNINISSSSSKHHHHINNKKVNIIIIIINNKNGD